MSELPTEAPITTVETEPFWEAAARGQLVLPRCDACGTYIWYPRRFCPACHDSSVSWVASRGLGTVYTFTVVRKASGRWAGSTPFVIAYVELDEGPRMMTNIVECDPAAVHIGQRVTVTFDRAEDGTGVPRFRPA